MDNWVNKYIGIPYVVRGESFDGADCLGLAKLIYREELDIQLPNYNNIGTEDLDAAANEIATHKDGWVRVDEPSEFCVVLLKLAGYPIHLGVCINNSEMIHSLKCHNSAIERFNGMKWNKRIEGFYVYNKVVS